MKVDLFLCPVWALHAFLQPQQIFISAILACEALLSPSLRVSIVWPRARLWSQTAWVQGLALLLNGWSMSGLSCRPSFLVYKLGKTLIIESISQDCQEVVRPPQISAVININYY